MAAAEYLTTTVTSALKTFYIDTFLSHFHEVLVLQGAGQSTEIPEAGGKTADWFRYHPADIVTSAGTEGLLGSDTTFLSFAGFNVTATVETWNNQWRFSELVHLTSRDRRLEKAAELVGQNAAESIERETLKILAESNIWPLPANAINSSTGAQDAGAYVEDVTVATATSTTVLMLTDATLTITSTDVLDDVLVGGWMCVSKGAGYGHSARITAYTSDNRQITFTPALPEAAVVAGGTNPTKITIGTPFSNQDLLATGDILTTEILQKAEEVLFKNGAKPMDDGFFAVYIHPAVYRNLLNDSTWVALMQNLNGSSGLQNAEIGTWSRMKFFRMTTAARYAATAETANSFSSTAGDVYVTLAMGKDSFGVVSLSGHSTPQLNIKIPGPNDGNTENPNNLYGTMGWKLYWKAKPLNANFCVGIMTHQG